VGLDVGEFPMH